MSRTSALGCVARTVLISGSSTGLAPPPRGAPSLASLRRTAAVPAAAALVSPEEPVLAGRTLPMTVRAGAPLRLRPEEFLADRFLAERVLAGGPPSAGGSAAAGSSAAPGASPSLGPPSAEPASAVPASAESEGAEPASAEPPSVEPTSAVLASVEPASVEPASVEPASVEPASAVLASAGSVGVEPPSAEWALVRRWASSGAAGGDATPFSAACSSDSDCSCCPAWTRVTSLPAVPAVTTSPATCAPHVRRSNKSIGGRFRKCRAPYVASRREQRPDVQTWEFCPPGEESELQQNDNSGHRGTSP